MMLPAYWAAPGVGGLLPTVCHVSMRCVESNYFFSSSSSVFEKEKLKKEEKR